MIGRSIRRINWPPIGQAEELLVVVAGLVLTVLLRWSLRNFQSEDYHFFTSGWYDTIQTEGFGAFASSFSDYTPLYLYLLYLVSIIFPKLDPVVAIKLPPMLADFACAWFVYRLVRLRYERGPVPVLAFFLCLLTPTVILNSALWGQADSLYTAALLACVYFIARGRQAAVFLAFGIAFAFKLQAIFLAPLLLALLLRRQLQWRYVLLVPLVYLVMIVPARLTGRPLVDLLTIYLGQAGSGHDLQMNMANMYVWLPNAQFDLFYRGGLVWAASMSFLFVYAVYKAERQISVSTLLLLALVSTVMVPYFTPKMHDRYFYPADILSIVWAFHRPKYFWVPLSIVLTSLLMYMIYLFKKYLVSLELLALVPLLTLVFIAWLAGTELYGARPELAAQE